MSRNAVQAARGQTSRMSSIVLKRSAVALPSWVLLAAAWGLMSLGVATAAERPNILFLFADDQSYQTIHELGNAQIQTPNLDRLSNEGTIFTRAYNMGGWHGAICVASRTMLNTGRSLWHARDIEPDLKQEQFASRMWAPLMKSAGYRTYFTGKWHVKIPPEQIFDVARHERPGMPKDSEVAYNRPLEGQPDPWDAADPQFGGYWQGGKHWSEVVADDAIDYLHDAQGREEPFFMYVAFNAPHDPRQAPQAYLDLYSVENMLVPENFQKQYPFKDAIGNSPSLRDEHLGPFPRTEYAVRVHRREYFAIITHLDAQIGRILAALNESGKRDNTWIFYTADHGLAVGQHGFLGKQNMYEHSVRVPFLVSGPGVNSQRRINTPIHLQDVMPTTLELAGAAQPDHVEFSSLLPLLNHEHADTDRPVYGAYMLLQRMITDDGYKLLLYPEAGVYRLYHVAEDPLELRDLAGHANALPIARRLFSRLLTLQNQYDDPLDLRETFAVLASTE